MTKVPAALLLSRPAPVAAALVGLALLDEARAALGRIDASDDGDALHDFRVAVRRLRTLLRAFRPELGDAASKKLQRRLRDVTRLTSTGRDAEVQFAWVTEHRSEIPRGSRAGLPWLLARLVERRDRARHDVPDTVTPVFRQAERRVRRALIAVSEATGRGRPAFGVAAARVLRTQAAALERDLAAARSAQDAEAIHGARIAVKRVRYLIEWLGAEVGQASPLIARLREQQDFLGELHDVHVLIAELGDAVADAAAERARSQHARVLDTRPRRATASRRGPAPGSGGLLALARLASETQARLMRRLTTDPGDVEPRALVRDLSALADSLLRAPRPTVTRASRRPALRRVRQAAG